MPKFLSDIYFNNTILDYLIFLLSCIVSFLIIKVVRYIVIRRLKRTALKTKTSKTEFVFRVIKKYILPFLYIAAIYLNLKILQLSPAVTEIKDMVVLAVMSIICATLLSSVLIYIFSKYIEKKNNDMNNKTTLLWISVIIKIVIWVIVLILFLDNIGVEINTLIAGLGIGGVAIAFAAQSIFTDIFCYFTIFFDRPFAIGDFLTVGEEMGTVEHIGVKTTRLRALSGEQLIFSNSDLTSSRIKNYKTMEQRRVLFTISITYDTKSEQLKEIPTLMKSIIDNVQDVTFSRAHFVSFGAYSLNFEIVYYILSNDYDKYMDIHHQVNLCIKEEFDKNNIKFAFPTQTLYMHPEEGETPEPKVTL